MSPAPRNYGPKLTNSFAADITVLGRCTGLLCPNVQIMLVTVTQFVWIFCSMRY